MFGIELIGSLLGLFPATIELAKTYRRTDPSGPSDISRSIAVTSTLFETTVRGFIARAAPAVSPQELQRLFPSQDPLQPVKTLWEDPAVQQRLLALQQSDKLPLMFDYLREMHVLLEKVKLELAMICRDAVSLPRLPH